ncbi:MAG: COX15/CtaA family protein [Hyphomicrobium sp.]|nr:COX15/CtaA family protein [Hyphomicrobium sp.]
MGSTTMIRDASSAASAKAAGGTTEAADRAVAAWLWAVAGLVLAMIVVGGATRLTDSGLSITEWKPILGAIPPLTHADWLEAFEKYRQIPEYHLVNKGMTLEEFEFIYWWEWSHRFLGRVIGLAFAFPLLFFWLRGSLRPGHLWKYLGVLALGAVQGGIGWYMVQSGLVDRVDVSQYRLALHLSVAFLILGCLVWLAMDLKPRRVPSFRTVEALDGAFAGAALIVGLVFLQVVLGAFVAGLKAGLHFNTWPLMNGALIPEGLFSEVPWVLNFFENPTTTQFNHRIVAYVVVALGLWHAWTIIRRGAEGDVRASALLLAGGLAAQMALGIVTLLHAVPIGLGIAHQGFAAVVMALAVRHMAIVLDAKRA